MTAQAEVLYETKRVRISRITMVIGYAILTVIVSELLLIFAAKLLMAIGVSELAAWAISIMLHIVPTAIAMLLQEYA